MNSSDLSKPLNLSSRLYAILDVDLCAARGLDPRRVFDAWLGAGVRLVQLRAKSLAGGPLLTMAGDFASAARAVGATFILNDRPDLARLAGAAGVHLGQSDLPPRAARAICGPEAMIGLSTHSRSELHPAFAEPVDYVAVGAVFPTSMKGPAHPVVGLDLVREAAALGRAHRRPIVGIGGIGLDTARRVIEAGASAVAVITDLLEGDPADRARRFLEVLGG
ncbi:MAG TPA: thiamine phosphate synthase [Vicinamibacterales bacterium]|nr:thiamine phosphate synthase [Vicinamibacterales bacterium]